MPQKLLKIEFDWNTRISILSWNRQIVFIVGTACFAICSYTRLLIQFYNFSLLSPLHNWSLFKWFTWFSCLLLRMVFFFSMVFSRNSGIFTLQIELVKVQAGWNFAKRVSWGDHLSDIFSVQLKLVLINISDNFQSCRF